MSLYCLTALISDLKQHAQLSVGNCTENYIKICFKVSSHTFSVTPSDLSSYVDSVENTSTGDY